MKKTYPFCCLLFCFYFLLLSFKGITASTDNVSEVNINTGWEYRKANEGSWSVASIPGCIHTDLLNDNKIEDPFFRLNEKTQQWIGESDWEYRTSFIVTQETIKEQNIDLIFEGLDTYADVYLNEEKILSADNMFRSWEVDVKSKLKEGQNELRIYFHNVFKINRPKYEQADYRLQAFPNNDQADIKLNLYSRKAGFHYGWDWGPRLVTTGIWKPVRLRAWSNFKINNVYYRQQEVGVDKAEISAEFNIMSTTEVTVELTISHENTLLANKKLDLQAGENKIILPFTIENPKLWWTNNLGEQPLYTLKSMLESKNGKNDEINTRIGIRSIEIIRNADTFGKSFYVKLNGIPIFIKGANYIPQDNFQNRVTRDRYEHIIGSAKDANMNMLRVWGGGIYEENLFYELCDEHGILVWQDVMFACGMYPSSDDFLENVKHEVIDNFTRLRNHPSIALYCGNNENEISWYAWGWKDLYESSIQKQYEEDLKKLFYETIPEAIAVVDPDRYYHPSSPIAGIGEDRPKEDGDTHYWGVWHGKEPFENFDKNISRFVSEYGFQSYPEFASIKKFTLKEDWDLESEVMHAHQRCMADDRKDIDYGNRLINTYLERNFRVPKNFEYYIYTVQALQAKGVKMAVESHRRNKTNNYCMGTMYWQINDCWPAASWSSIDYYGKWKALHYLVKKAYSQVLITPLEKEGKLNIYLISDELSPISNAKIKIQLLDFNGNKLWTYDKEIKIEANTSLEYLSIILDDLPKEFDRKSTYLKMAVSSKGKTLSENRYYFENEALVELPKVKIDYNIKRSQGGYELVLTADKLAKYVYISSNLEDFFIDDNYFDLDGSEQKTVKISSGAKLEDLQESIKIISLVDSY